MIRKVHLRGIKSLVDVELELDPFTVLVGPNGCGKSTLLDQVELACRMAAGRGGGETSLGPAGDVLKTARLEELRTSVRSMPSEWEVSDASANVFRVTAAPAPPNRWYEGVTIEVQAGGMRATRNHAAPPEAWNTFEAVLAQLPSWRAQRLALAPRMLRAPSEVTVGELRPDGYGLPTILKDLAAAHTGAYLAVQADLRRVVPHFRELRPGGARVLDRDRGPVVPLELQMSQGLVPARQVSDGTLLALAVLTAAHHPDLPSLLLIDDLDHGLHLSAQYALVKALGVARESRPELRVLCTTHSPFMFEEVDGAWVRVMALDDPGATRVKRLSEPPEYERWRSGMTTGELWANLGEAWVLDG